MSDETILKDISEKLDILIRLTALDVVKGREFREQVRVLDQGRLKPKEIATILGKTPNSISMALFRMRREATTEPQAEQESETSG
jgi:ABC-type methionine transport system ATPase subunit